METSRRAPHKGYTGSFPLKKASHTPRTIRVLSFRSGSNPGGLHGWVQGKEQNSLEKVCWDRRKRYENDPHEKQFKKTLSSLEIDLLENQLRCLLH